MENTTFAMPTIIDSHDMGLRTVFSPDAQKKTSIQRLLVGVECHLPRSSMVSFGDRFLPGSSSIPAASTPTSFWVALSPR
ncbi:hypothetical protein TNCV_4492771 [Trichonephila clavipes]|uniref:Uncharacterized protein n=1 Tax=Trichonephila clavipes TaxID=2585209 RepID=A0A8X6VNZ5_TRICX|nr:hypothetical protein TNCV_4492771 [Trichonephila clavipes]